jgi:hypothetical protein
MTMESVTGEELPILNKNIQTRFSFKCTRQWEKVLCDIRL